MQTTTVPIVREHNFDYLYATIQTVPIVNTILLGVFKSKALDT